MKEELLTTIIGILIYENDTEIKSEKDLDICDVNTCNSLFINERFVYKICIKSVETVCTYQIKANNGKAFQEEEYILKTASKHDRTTQK